MKKKLSYWVLFILAAFAALAVTGCVTTGDGYTTKFTNNGNFGKHIRTPVKDFVTLGLVFTETRLADPDSGSGESQIFTYQALLKEAQKIGADAIINVVIDRKIQRNVSSYSSITTLYGSALAIKYTVTLAETMVTSDGVATTSTTSVYFNDGGAANTGSVTAELSAEEKSPAPSRGIRQ
jgi:hypothetical protein